MIWAKGFVHQQSLKAKKPSDDGFFAFADSAPVTNGEPVTFLKNHRFVRFA
ncbi:hypothetical protein MIZ03_2643 [Rhodoferax lithotrophicus]|uniref:Uncharacterized protein n=1 Tax=Rhodoferax lithotrophicus TaxID=2798804 RepID=A0ABM7MN89_9BURK|nr:hypothetical protein MIZ03_2643 [Rhodoferax sp. MIZ03]